MSAYVKIVKNAGIRRYKMINPCKSCPERTPGCHSRCPYYAEYEQAQNERRERIKAERDKDTGWSGYKRDTVDKRVRRG